MKHSDSSLEIKIKMEKMTWSNDLINEEWDMPQGCGVTHSASIAELDECVRKSP